MPDVHTLIILCPLVFLGSFVDAIGGGGGLITLPAYLLVGLPAHLAIGTNKMSSMVGTSFSAARYIRNGFVDWRLAVPCVACALAASLVGAHFSMLLPEELFRWVLICALPVVAVVTLRKKSLRQESDPMSRRRRAAIMCAVALLCGLYDGFYGPGTGTFLILGYSALARLGVQDCAGQTKCANLASNIAGFVSFLVAGQCWFVLGAVASVFSIAGHYLGAGMVVRDGSRIVRPIIVCVLAVLFAKTIGESLGLVA